MIRSAKLRRMPENIIIIACHDFAGVSTKLAKALSIRYNVKIVNPINETKKRMNNIFSLPPKRSLAILVEPGELKYSPHTNFDTYLFPTIAGVKRPNTMPWGLYWVGSIYRVSNFAAWKHIPKKHVKWLMKRRSYFNSLTPLRMCGTADLSIIDRGSTFVGEAYNFPETQRPISYDHRILHIPTAPDRTDLFKGTHRIREAFSQLDRDNILKTNICKYKTPHNTVLREMRRSTMLIHAMNDYGGDIGYAGIEAISNGCVVFNKLKPHVRNPVVDVQRPKDLVAKAKRLVNNKDEYRRIRKLQFEWGKKNLSFEGVCRTVTNTIKQKVRTGWKD